MSTKEINNNQINDRYDPKIVEKKHYENWKANECFSAENNPDGEPYTVILPPPNVTGFLHLGHALNHTIQDILIRWKRMNSYKSFWLPGTDHAGIATQSVVEKKLYKEEGKKRIEMGREGFLDQVWKWKDIFEKRICSQMECLGDSVDWEKKVFTLDPKVSQSVNKVFVDLYKKGFIYKGQRLVNWSPVLQTAISDLEVEYKEANGSIWHIKYNIENSDQQLIVATTRPETFLGDTAICVHPEDERYKDLVGKNAVLPISGRVIPIIADNYVDKEFGTGVVKITPAHDFNDYEIGLRHKLPMINLLNKDGTLNENAGEFKGLKVQEARKQIVKALETNGYLEKTEKHKNKIGYCSRSGAVSEPFLSEQWFMKMSDLAVPAKEAVERGKIKFKPESWSKTFLHWMNIIQDWCISRQLWWGHQIPAWYCSDCEHISVSEDKISSCEKCKSKNIKQDEDVLDTWFSSGLWPFTTMGWPEDTDLLKKHYPSDVLVTGHDIIFFWVARMVMMGIHFKDEVPFKTVYMHGLIRDSKGQKMSKSLGNSLDPLELIEQYGADALRFTLMASMAPGKDIKFSEQRLEGYRNFMNKIWNASRFSLNLLESSPEILVDGVLNSNEINPTYLADQWILMRLANVENLVDKALDSYGFQEAANQLYSFVWHDFCDWYLELIKPVVYSKTNTSDEKSNTLNTLFYVLKRSLALLHPFCPFITEELFEILPFKKDKLLILSEYPNQNNSLIKKSYPESVIEIEFLKEAVVAVRNVRGENSIKMNLDIMAFFVSADDEIRKLLNKNKDEIIRLARLKTLDIVETADYKKSAVVPLTYKGKRLDVVIPLEGLVDFKEEVKRIQKNIEKIDKDISILTKKLSNKKFIENAPEELVLKDKSLLAKLNENKISLEQNLKRLI